MIRETAIHLDLKCRPVDLDRFRSLALSACSSVDSQIDRTGLDLGPVRKVIVMLSGPGPAVSDGDGALSVDGSMARVASRLSEEEFAILFHSDSAEGLALKLLDALGQLTSRLNAPPWQLEEVRRNAHDASYETVVRRSRISPDGRLRGSFVGVISGLSWSLSLSIEDSKSGNLMAEKQISMRCDYWNLKAYAKLLKWEPGALSIRTKPGAAPLSLNLQIALP